jgi:hypothetical protein
MGGFLQNNWFWLLLVVFFIWMHRSDMECGGHGGHRHRGARERRAEGSRHRH